MKRLIFIFMLAAVCLLNVNYSLAENTAKDSVQELRENINLSDFILGPGDKVDIKVYRNDDLSYSIQVDPSGKISYPLLGDVLAAGLTVFQLRDAIAKGLAKFIQDPQVTVNVSSYISHTITVLGEITTPGLISISSQQTIMEIISRAGGFGANAEKNNVVVIRKQPPDAGIMTVNIKKALEGDKTQNILLKRDDVVYVPKIEAKVVLMGEVTTPGSLQLDTPLRIFEAISKVGGFSANANKNNVLLIRDENGESKLISVDVQKALESGDISQNLLMQKGDVIYVSRDSKRIILLGEVTNPGYFSFDTPLTILDAISKAGGFTSNANAKKVALIRKGPNKSENVKFIDIKKVLKEGDVENGSIILQNGDIVYVPTTFIADVETVLTHIRNIFSTFTSVESPVVLWPQFKSAIQGSGGSRASIVVPSSQ